MKKLTVALAVVSAVAASSSQASQQLDRNYHVHPHPSQTAQQQPQHQVQGQTANTKMQRMDTQHSNAKAQQQPQNLHPDLTRSNALHFSIGDKSYSITIFGQVFVNHSMFGGAYNVGGDGMGHSAQQTQLESARLGVTGNLLQNWTYAVYLANRASAPDSDDNSDIYVRNAFIQYTGFKFATFTLGKQNPNFGVDNMHDANNTYGTNFSLMSQAFAPPIATGLALHSTPWQQHVVFDAGVYHTGVVSRDNASSPRGGQGYQNESREVTTRLVVVPILHAEQHEVLLLEGSFVHYNGSDDPVAGINVNGSVAGTLADAGNPPVTAGPFAKGTTQDFSNVYNAGFAGEYGPVSIEGGYAWMRSSLTGAANETANYSAGYVQAGVVLTGEARGYNADSGYLIGVTQPDHRYGAFELIGRVDRINLVSNAGENNAAIGDRATDFVAGINWYLNRHIRFALDGAYLKVSGPSAVVGSGLGGTIQAGYVF